MHLKTIEWKNDAVVIIDQTKLPTELVYERIEKIEQMYTAIRELKVRGAPAIGIAAAFGLYLAVRQIPDSGKRSDFQVLLEKNADYLAQSRPTAVNLFWAIDRMRRKALAVPQSASIAEIKQVLFNEAQAILDEDRSCCRAIGAYGLELLGNKRNILTHCNAGGLATGEYGTALAPIYVGAEKGLKFHVWVDETRPLLQGARITAFELQYASISATLICDNMSASVMSRGNVEAVIVGADRIASNGDTANKIGTYGLALIAKAHNVPFYIAAPQSTFDLTLRSGKEIPIEERKSEEVTLGFGKRTAPENIQVFNPAFDVTPSHLISAIITEKGVIVPPFSENIAKILG